jgi:enamine deaminase RidA (YjgF/YER057c/UK114 family)
MLDKYLIILPEVSGSVVEEFEQCLGQMRVERTEGYHLVKLNIFVDSPDYNSCVELSFKIGDLIDSFFGKNCPAYNIIPQPPQTPCKVSVEAGFVRDGDFSLESKSFGTHRYVIGTSGTLKVLWASGFGNGLFPGDPEAAAESAFDQMRSLLSAEDMSFNDIVRQWNYIGEITDITEKGENYHVFNKVRSRQYGKYRSVHGFPAATGIGMKHGGVSLDCIAVKAGDNHKIIAVNNPDQVKPYEYGRIVLQGIQVPQFERALLLSGSNDVTLFVSGTASILGQDTVGIDDIEKQTVITIENIMKLVEASHHNSKADSPSCDLSSLILLRVYVKKQSDFEKVKKICNSYFIGAPAVYIEADVCRENLLVEIEAEFSKRI